MAELRDSGFPNVINGKQVFLPNKLITIWLVKVIFPEPFQDYIRLITQGKIISLPDRLPLRLMMKSDSLRSDQVRRRNVGRGEIRPIGDLVCFARPIRQSFSQEASPLLVVYLVVEFDFFVLKPTEALQGNAEIRVRGL